MKPTKPKPFIPTYGMLAVMMASPTEPMPSFMRNENMDLLNKCIKSITEGDNPTPDDWRWICDCIHIMNELVHAGIAQDEYKTIDCAVKAMQDTARRASEGKPIRLDGYAIMVIKGVIEDYQTALEEVPHRTIVQCRRAVEKQAWEARHGMRKGESAVSI
jgi:hypothetical protein